LFRHETRPRIASEAQSQKTPANGKAREFSTSPAVWTRALDRLPLQAKLRVNQPGDTYEQEADQVAAQVMRMPEPRVQRACACGGEAGPDSECEACRAKRLGLQRKSDNVAGTDAPTSVHNVLRSPGQPLDTSARSFMEPRFGQDFSQVRVHTDAQAAESARAVNALAYTVGHDVVFGAGQYGPGTSAGQLLLAHELTHVLQQRQEGGALQRQGSVPATHSQSHMSHDSVQATRLTNRTEEQQASVGGAPPVIQMKLAINQTEEQEEILVGAPPVIQTKLAINQPGDRYEQEADRIAQRVIQMPEPAPQSHAKGAEVADRQGKETQQRTAPATKLTTMPPPGLPIGHRTNGPLVARANTAQTTAVLSTGAIASVQFFPTAVAGTKVGPVSGLGGLVQDVVPARLSAIIDRGTTLRNLAGVLLPLWNTATPFTPPGATAPLPIVPLTADELARGLLVYNRYYVPVPAMTRWRIGLRFPLPVEIGATTNEGTLHPDIIRQLASGFDAVWEPLLDQPPLPIAAPSAADLQQAVRTFLAATPDALGQGIHLSARAITNAADEHDFILEAFNQLGVGAFDTALAFMDFIVNHQVALLASQRASAEILDRIRTILAAPAPNLSANQQTSLTRANGMLGRVAAIQARPDVCVPNRQLTWADFAGAPGGGTFGALTSFTITTTVFQGQPLFQAILNSGASWVKPQAAQPANPAVNGCAPSINKCTQDFAQLQPGQTMTWAFSGAPSAQCPASFVPSASVIANSQGDCAMLIGPECARAAQLESARLLRHEQLHFDIACVLAHKANAALARGSALATVRAAVNTRSNQLTNQYDNNTNHGCNAANQATWETNVGNSLPAVTIP
jgi:hypothetical protein